MRIKVFLLSLSLFQQNHLNQGSPVESPVQAVQPRFNLNPVQMIGSDRNGDRSTVGPIGPAGPVRFLKHWSRLFPYWLPKQKKPTLVKTREFQVMLEEKGIDLNSNRQ